MRCKLWYKKGTNEMYGVGICEGLIGCRLCRRGDPNQCLPNFLKMLLLALPQIYTLVFH